MGSRWSLPVTLGAVVLLACQQNPGQEAETTVMGATVPTLESETARCNSAAAESNNAQRLGEALGLCLEKHLPGPFAILLEVQVNEAGTKLLAQSGASPLIARSILETCVLQPIRQWSSPPVSEVLKSRTGLVQSMSLELAREQGGELHVRTKSVCTPPLPGETLHSAMEPLEMAPDCEAPLGSAAQSQMAMLFGLNMVRARSDKGAVCSPVTDGLPSGYITCMCADLLARDAAKAARRSPSEREAAAKPAEDGRRHWILRRVIADRPTYHRLEGLAIQVP